MDKKYFKNIAVYDEVTAIERLLNLGYLVVVVDPRATDFSKKYKVFQNATLGKTVVVNNFGKPVALQG